MAMVGTREPGPDRAGGQSGIFVFSHGAARRIGGDAQAKPQQPIRDNVHQVRVEHIAPFGP